MRCGGHADYVLRVFSCMLYTLAQEFCDLVAEHYSIAHGSDSFGSWLPSRSTRVSLASSRGAFLSFLPLQCHADLSQTPAKDVYGLAGSSIAHSTRLLEFTLTYLEFALVFFDRFACD